MRDQTPIDGFAESWLNQLLKDSPMLATEIGVDLNQHQLDDFSPERIDDNRRKIALAKSELSAIQPEDFTDEITKHAMLADFDSKLEIVDSGWVYRDLNNIASAVQGIRDVFDLMPMNTLDNWENVSSRIADIPRAIAGYQQTLEVGVNTNQTPAKRQVVEVIQQIRELVSPKGPLQQMVLAGSAEFTQLDSRLHNSFEKASASLQEFQGFLQHDLLPSATDNEAVGRDLYSLLSNRFLGQKIDLDETYVWGLEQLAEIEAEQLAVANQIKPGVMIEEAFEILDRDPAYQIEGSENLRAWMQGTSDLAVKQLDGVFFEIPAPLMALECMISPTNQGGIHYTQPAEDFSRPGRMWWSIPTGVNNFSTWREKTTVYHEGVPGHHLQLGWQVYNKDLNGWRRNVSWTSGHGEGWALYAEQLMQEFGFLDDPADRMGMLDAQRMRAARVVLDIGVHLEKEIPEGGQTWDYEYAKSFMRRNVSMNDKSLEFEINRYFGWPGQAPSYKIGQRVWNQLRSDQQARLGSKFDLKKFHSDALKLGGVGLDTLLFAFK